jgi:hypothetical protein
MALDLVLRDYRDRLRNESLRGLWWNVQGERALRGRLRDAKLASIAHYVAGETAHLASNLEDAAGGNDARLNAAIGWLLRAQAATPDDGVSLGYFPLHEAEGWRPSYPETTGYIITTLVRAAQALSRPELLTHAMAMGDWEISVQMDSGAVQGGPLVPKDKRTAAAFNTGMVLDGLCSLYEATGEARFLEAASRAGQFLQRDVDEAGFFQTNGAFVSGSTVKTYTCLCAWAMLRLARLAHMPALETAALRVVEAALRKQAPNGWYADNCLNRVHVPLTHTIGYTVQGILEVGLLAGREDFVASARKAAAAALAAQRGDGFLPGRLDSTWRGATNSVCLTGSVQLAVAGFRLAGVSGDRALAELAHSVLRFVAATQRLEGDNPALIGGIAGSYPFLGGYMTAGFPNWATKYFIDALLAEREHAAAHM